MSSEIDEAVHMVWTRPRIKAERATQSALALMAREPSKRGPLVAYVAASSLSDELTIKEARIRRAIDASPIADWCLSPRTYELIAGEHDRAMKLAREKAKISQGR